MIRPLPGAAAVALLLLLPAPGLPASGDFAVADAAVPLQALVTQGRTALYTFTRALEADSQEAAFDVEILAVDEVGFAREIELPRHRVSLSPAGRSQVRCRVRWDHPTQRYLFNFSTGHEEGAAQGLRVDAEVTDLALTYAPETGFTGTGPLRLYGSIWNPKASQGDNEWHTVDARVAITTDAVTQEQVWRVASVDGEVRFQFAFGGG